MDDFLAKHAGADGRGNTNAADPKDFQKYCTEGAMAILGSMLFGMGLCFAICLWRERKKRLSAPSGAQPNPSSYPSRLDSRTTRPSTSESWPEPQQPSSVPGKPARLPGSTWEPALASPESHPAFPTPPPPPPLPNSASRPQPQQPSPVPGKPARLPGSTREPAPASADSHPALPTPPTPPPLPISARQPFGTWPAPSSPHRN
ncbi:uncharacterized protein FN964_014849 [Alca torda]